MDILGFSILDITLFVIVFGIATSRVSRLLMNEESFLWTGYIFTYIVGMRYTRMIPDEQMEDFDPKEFPQVLGLIKTVSFAKNNNLGAYRLESKTYISKIFNCVFCTSYWVAILAVLGLLLISQNPLSLESIWYGAWIASAISQVSLFFYRRS